MDLMKKTVPPLLVPKKLSNAMTGLVSPEQVSAMEDGNVLMVVMRHVVTKE
jgi:hypothetical protein